MDSSLEVSATEKNSSFWLGQGLARQNFREVSAAEVLIVPFKDFREGVPFAFHQDTPSFARYLAKNLAGQAKIEVLADDEEYIEIALHGASIRLSTIVVSAVIAPVMINLLSSYIYDELKAKPGDTVEMSLVIEDNHCRAMHVGFKGDAKDFVSAADRVRQIARECMEPKGRAAPQPLRSIGDSTATETEFNELADDQF